MAPWLGIAGPKAPAAFLTTLAWVLEGITVPLVYEELRRIAGGAWRAHRPIAIDVPNL